MRQQLEEHRRGLGEAHDHGHDHGQDQGHHAGHHHGPAEQWVPVALWQRPQTFWQKARDFLWGLFFFEYYHELKHERAKYADTVNLILYGELLGLPLMNSTVGLRLLPHMLLELQGFKHRQLEEKEVMEEAPHIH